MKFYIPLIVACAALAGCAAQTPNEKLTDASLSAGKVSEDWSKTIAIGMSLRAALRKHEIVRLTHGDPETSMLPTTLGVITHFIKVRLQTRRLPGAPEPSIWTRTPPEDECLTMSFSHGRFVRVAPAGLTSCDDLPHDLTEAAKAQTRERETKFAARLANASKNAPKTSAATPNVAKTQPAPRSSPAAE